MLEPEFMDQVSAQIYGFHSMRLSYMTNFSDRGPDAAHQYWDMWVQWTLLKR